LLYLLFWLVLRSCLSRQPAGRGAGITIAITAILPIRVIGPIAITAIPPIRVIGPIDPTDATISTIIIGTMITRTPAIARIGIGTNSLRNRKRRFPVWLPSAFDLCMRRRILEKGLNLRPASMCLASRCVFRQILRPE